MSKQSQMKKIKDEIVSLESSPLFSYRKENKYFPVIGEGSHDASIMFVGEAPGKSEAECGRPFCGAAGRVLDELLDSINIGRSSVYVTNIVKDRPPGNRDPLPEEIELYAPFLERQIEIIRPKAVATLGRFSMHFLLGKFGSEKAGESISRLHGKVLSVQAPFGEISIVPLYHPAVALYKATMKDELMKDFSVLKQFI